MSTNSGLTSILNSLQNYSRIKLSKLYNGDEGERELAIFLRTTQNVKNLELKGNNIGPSGIKEILRCSNPTPSEVSSANGII